MVLCTYVALHISNVPQNPRLPVCPWRKREISIITLIYGQKSWDAERLRGLPKPTQQVSVRSRIRLGVFWHLLSLCNQLECVALMRCSLSSMETLCEAFRNVQRPCFGDNAVHFCLYFNIDLCQLFYWSFQEAKKIAFSGEKFRLKYCSAGGDISCWADCEGQSNLAQEALR